MPFTFFLYLVKSRYSACAKLIVFSVWETIWTLNEHNKKTISIIGLSIYWFILQTFIYWPYCQNCSEYITVWLIHTTAMCNLCQTHAGKTSQMSLNRTEEKENINVKLVSKRTVSLTGLNWEEMFLFMQKNAKNTSKCCQEHASGYLFVTNLSKLLLFRHEQKEGFCSSAAARDLPFAQCSASRKNLTHHHHQRHHHHMVNNKARKQESFHGLVV